MQMLRRQLTSDELRQWDEDGYLLLRGIIPAERLTAVQREFERVVDEHLATLLREGKITDTRPDLPFARRFAEVATDHANQFGRSWRKSLASRAVFDLQGTPELVDVLSQLAGADVIGHPVFNGRPKLPGKQLTIVPWHQDSGYFGAGSDKSLIITTWIPLVHVDASNGCLQVIPGSHKSDLHAHHEEDREGKFLEADLGDLDESTAITCVMDPGDVLLFPNLTMHRSLASVTPDIRWSIDLRFIRDGDTPGAINWSTPDFKWIIRSPSKPVTSYESWMADIEQWKW